MTRLKLALLMLVALTASTALWHRYKPLPPGLNVQGETHAVQGLKLLVDDTWESDNGVGTTRLSRQHIFDEFFRLIGQAEKLIVVDMFLFNDFQGTPTRAAGPCPASSPTPCWPDGPAIQPCQSWSSPTPSIRFMAGSTASTLRA